MGLILSILLAVLFAGQSWADSPGACSWEGDTCGSELTLADRLVPTTIEVSAATDALTAEEMDGRMFYADFATGPMVYTLPAASVGLSACFYDTEGDGITIDPLGAGDRINLDGTLLDLGEAINSPGVAGGPGSNPGDFICVHAKDSVQWTTLGRSGTWVEETP